MRAAILPRVNSKGTNTMTFQTQNETIILSGTLAGMGARADAERENEMREWAEAEHANAISNAIAHSNSLCHEDYAIAREFGFDTSDYSQCDSCGYHATELTYALLRNRNDSHEVCEDCRNSYYFYCEESDTYYNENHFTRTYYNTRRNGQLACVTVCAQYMSLDSDAYQRTDGEFYDEPEYDDDDDDDDGSCEDVRIPGYHSARRDWQTPARDALSFGIELETYCPDAHACYRFVGSGIVAERDGSLDSYHGLEFIGAPMTLAEYQADASPWRMLLAKLRAAGATSWQANRGGMDYGMHISVNRSMQPAHELRFVLFINNNEELSALIAGRNSSRWAGYNLKQSRDVTDALQNGGTKYSATNVDGSRIEVRIFRGTLSDAGFMRNVEFCAAVQHFTRARRNLASITQPSRFLTWLSSNRKTYRALADFLIRKGQLSADVTVTTDSGETLPLPLTMPAEIAAMCNVQTVNAPTVNAPTVESAQRDMQAANNAHASAFAAWANANDPHSDASAPLRNALREAMAAAARANEAFEAAQTAVANDPCEV